MRCCTFIFSHCIDVVVPIIHSSPVNPPTTMDDVSDLHTVEADGGTPPVAAATLNDVDIDTHTDMPPPMSPPSHPKKSGKKQASTSPDLSCL
jgi:hypothetical protein